MLSGSFSEAGPVSAMSAEGRLRPVEPKGSRHSVWFGSGEPQSASSWPAGLRVITLAIPGMSAVPLIPVAGDGVADEPDGLRCARHRKFELRPSTAATAAKRAVTRCGAAT